MHSHVLTMRERISYMLVFTKLVYLISIVGLIVQECSASRVNLRGILQVSDEDLASAKSNVCGYDHISYTSCNEGNLIESSKLVYESSQTSPDIWPYLVSLQRPARTPGCFTHKCSGILTSPTTIMTSGACIRMLNFLWYETNDINHYHKILFNENEDYQINNNNNNNNNTFNTYNTYNNTYNSQKISIDDKTKVNQMNFYGDDNNNIIYSSDYQYVLPSDVYISNVPYCRNDPGYKTGERIRTVTMEILKNNKENHDFDVIQIHTQKKVSNSKIFPRLSCDFQAGQIGWCAGWQDSKIEDVFLSEGYNQFSIQKGEIVILEQDVCKQLIEKYQLSVQWPDEDDNVICGYSENSVAGCSGGIGSPLIMENEKGPPTWDNIGYEFAGVLAHVPSELCRPNSKYPFFLGLYVQHKYELDDDDYKKEQDDDAWDSLLVWPDSEST